MAETAEMLGITERTFRRWKDRSETEGGPSSGSGLSSCGARG